LSKTSERFASALVLGVWVCLKPHGSCITRRSSKITKSTLSAPGGAGGGGGPGGPGAGGGGPGPGAGGPGAGTPLKPLRPSHLLVFFRSHTLSSRHQHWCVYLQSFRGALGPGVQV